jgi:hypothetical protein
MEDGGDEFSRNVGLLSELHGLTNKEAVRRKFKDDRDEGCQIWRRRHGVASVPRRKKIVFTGKDFKRGFEFLLALFLFEVGSCLHRTLFWSRMIKELAPKCFRREISLCLYLGYTRFESLTRRPLLSLKFLFTLIRPQPFPYKSFPTHLYSPDADGVVKQIIKRRDVLCFRKFRFELQKCVLFNAAVSIQIM